MVDVTYKTLHPSDPRETIWDGKVFQADKPVKLDGRSHKDFIERAKLNPWFDVDGESAPQAKSKDRPETVEEYRSYAMDWINKAKSVRELEGRWRAEEGKREELGWGEDDQKLVDPIYQPKLERLTQAENEQ